MIKNIKDERKIDLVYLWVDGNDEKWRKEKEKWAKKLGIASDAVNDCRFIDNEELRYSLRSVAKNAPWINQIFIVTNGQVPYWLDTSHPKIKIITHDQIMPKDALPTFNSEAIETCIANIPGLSEYFLYANDDCFIGSPVTPDYFFDSDGKPIVRLVPQKWSKEVINNKLYQGNVTYCANLIYNTFNRKFPYESSHNIDVYRVSYIKKCLDTYSEVAKRTTYARFRQRDSFQKTIYSFYMLAKKQAVFRKCNIHFHLRPLENLYMTINTPEKMKSVILQSSPKLFCINDDETVNFENRKQLKSFLVSIFKEVQPWEKPKKYQVYPLKTDKPTISVVFSLNDAYVKYFGVALQSLVANANKQYLYDIIIFETDISEKHKLQLQRQLSDDISIRFYNISEFFYEQFPQLSLVSMRYWGPEMYFRLFIPYIMSEYERILYLDSDMCINNDLAELFFTNFEGKNIAVVQDTVSPIIYSPKNKKRREFFQNSLQMKHPENYFNSGMILFNIKSIDIQKYNEKLLFSFKLPVQFPDQDMLNYIFYDNVKYMHSKWNYIYVWSVWDLSYINSIHGQFRKEFLEAREHHYIIHYTSSRKPWNYPSGELADIWWKYARQTPFYEEILFTNTNGKEDINVNKNWFVRKNIVNFLGIPILKIRQDSNSLRVWLFTIIPLFKITYRQRKNTFKLFNFITLFETDKIKKT